MVVVWIKIENREKFWVARVVGSKTRFDARRGEFNEIP
jgi:hypothetical protein